MEDFEIQAKKDAKILAEEDFKIQAKENAKIQTNIQIYDNTTHLT